MKYECGCLASLAKTFPEFGAECEIEGDPPRVLSLRLSGSIGNEVGVALLRDIDGALVANPSLVSASLDIRKVRYMCSTAVGALASLYMSAISKGVVLIIRDPSEQVATVLRVLGFENFLPISRSGEAR
jgi:anti-anti-sigma factor